MNSTDLASRYGTSRTHRLPTVVGVVIALAGLGWLGWAIWGQSDPKVTSALVTFDVANPHSASARIQVHLQSTDVRATCTLKATARDHTVVGERDVVVPQDRGRTMVLEPRIRTERKATSVELEGCVANGQKRPR